MKEKNIRIWLKHYGYLYQRSYCNAYDTYAYVSYSVSHCARPWAFTNNTYNTNCYRSGNDKYIFPYIPSYKTTFILMKLTRMHTLGIILGGIILVGDIVAYLVYSDKNLFFFILGIFFLVIALPFIIGISLEGKKEQEINEMFLEFSRNLAESVNTGTPISKSIINMKKNNYGELGPFINKLANQIALGIPVNTALKTFADDIDSNVIKRAVALISEAERAGGEIDYIIGSVAKSISEVEKLKKERMSSIYNLVVQGYIIFFIFIGIMLVMEFKILPLTMGMGSLGGGFSSFGSGSIENLGKASAGPAFSQEELSQSFLYLLLAQGFFAGLTIGKLTEGKIKAGIKHSFILTMAAFLISTGARLFLGAPK